MGGHAKNKRISLRDGATDGRCAFALHGTVSALWKRMHGLRNFVWLCTAAGLAGLGGCASVATNTSHTFDTVVIDAGHGGKDSGAVRRYSPAEKTLALDVALRVNQKLRESQLRTVMTRDNDTFIPLDTRVALGNAEKNSIFVSIHFNDSRRRGVRGVETYYHSAYAYDLAAAIEQKLDTVPGAENRGVHQARYRVIRNAHYPSVLVECGYLSNRGEGSQVSSAAYREQIADKIAEAIVDYRFGHGMYRSPTRMMAAGTSAGTVGTGFR